MPKIPPLETFVKLRRCCKCKVLKPVEEFYTNKSRSDGRHTQCKPCSKSVVKEWVHKNMSKVLLKNRLKRARDIRNGNVRRFIMDKLGSSRELGKRNGHLPCSSTIDELVPLYTQTCQICDTFVGRRIHMDHCHITGKFRGFICGGCNTVIGHSRESIEVLEKVVEYLKSHKA